MRSSLVVALAACHGVHTPDGGPLEPTANPTRQILDTKLVVDYGAMTAVATITFQRSATPGASLEIGNLAIDSVQRDGADVAFAVGGATNAQLDVALPASTDLVAIDVAYHWQFNESFTGASSGGYTLDWPYFCGNVFPCHSDPVDGSTFEVTLADLPAGLTAVYPTTIPTPAPAYQLAWSIDAYTQLDLGSTTAGTLISVWYRPGELANAQAGTAHLVAAFDWLEQTLGPYTFGPQYGSVSVAWPRGSIGGMEHHPFSHLSSTGFSNEETHVHEASHGWYGDGIRIKCWEDFVLSEGTVSYLTARALDVVEPALGASVWQGYAVQLGLLSSAAATWPQSCGQVDVLKGLFSNAPYMRGAFFYKGLADKLGADVIDRVLAKFYRDHVGGAAGMADMLATIQAETGYDPTACAQTWLLSMTRPTPAPCP